MAVASIVSDDDHDTTASEDDLYARKDGPSCTGQNARNKSAY